MLPMQSTARAPIWFLIANMLIVAASFALGVYVAQVPSLPQQQLGALAAIHAEILRSHVDAHDPDELVERAIHGMVDSLDQYSQYVPPSMAAQFVEATTGNYEGIGVVVHHAGPRLFVQFPFAGSPGERAGLEPGDEIVAVAGTRLANLDPVANARLVEERVRGPAGTAVELTVLPAAGGAERVVAIERAPVHKSAVKWVQTIGAGIGYAYLSDFHPGAARELQEAIDGLRKAHGELQGFVLDLRWNGGGNLDECIAMTRLFLRDGNILTIRRRGTEVVQSYDADPVQCRYPDLPLAVLVNERSASASEVLAGALQDHGRARLVGTRTFGKGMINTVTTYRSGFRLKLTTGRYYTPNGRSIEGHHREVPAGHPDAVVEGGIAPDRAIALADPQQAVRLHAALEAAEPPTRYAAAARALAERFELAPIGPLPADADPQLAAAVALLGAPGQPGAGK